MRPAEPASRRGYSLRPCHPDDAAFVLTLTETVIRANSERTFGAWDPDFHRAAFANAFGRLDHSIVVCNGAEAGYVAIDHRPDAEYLQWLLLMPAFQGRGLGSAIVSDLIAAAHGAGKPVQLRVLPINTGAQRLYARLGFAVTHTDEPFLYMEHAAGKGR
ncbi:MAG: GNAT family N-acetyltransferase [Pseudolabrys sp.]